MNNIKVEILGVDTSKLPRLSASEQMEMLRRIKNGENELKELKLLMSECSLDSYTKAQILEYVNIKAIDFALKGNKTVDDYDFKSHVYYLVANYLKDEKYVNIVRKEMPF